MACAISGVLTTDKLPATNLTTPVWLIEVGLNGKKFPFPGWQESRYESNASMVVNFGRCSDLLSAGAFPTANGTRVLRVVPHGQPRAFDATPHSTWHPRKLQLWRTCTAANMQAAAAHSRQHQPAGAGHARPASLSTLGPFATCRVQRAQEQSGRPHATLSAARGWSQLGLAAVSSSSSLLCSYADAPCGLNGVPHAAHSSIAPCCRPNHCRCAQHHPVPKPRCPH